MKKIISLLFMTILFLSCVSSPERTQPETSLRTEEKTQRIARESSVPEPKVLSIEGLWLQVWDHRAEGRPEHFPGSYCFQENPNFEYLYLFNEDGTGYMIERKININGLEMTSFNDTLAKIGNPDVSYEVLEVTAYDLLWQTNGDKISITIDRPYEPNQLLDYDFKIDPVEKHCDGVTKSVDKYVLDYEIIIVDFANMKKFNDADAAQFIKENGIDLL